MEFGELVTYLRRKAQLTQQDLARKAEISIQYLNQIEKGRALESIGDDIIGKINTALGITVDQFEKIRSGILNYSTPDQRQKEESAFKLLEIEKENRAREKENWALIESMLKDTIKRQDDRIAELIEQVNFLKALLEKK